MLVVGQYCKTCTEQELRKYASFNYPTEISPIYCSSHAEEGMVNVKRLRKGTSKLRETLATVFPELCKEWHPTKNTKSPKEYSKFSNTKVWWLCSKCGYEWKTYICNRSRSKRDCAVCANKQMQKI